MKKKIYITGVNGYLGKNLRNYLSLKFDVRFLEKKMNYSEINSLSYDFKGIDTVIHCAGLVHVNEKKVDYKDFYSSNVLLTKNIFKKAKKNFVKNFIFISSVSVYDLEKDFSSIDQDTIENPKTKYGRSKLEAENVLKKLGKDAKINLYILRPSMIIGNESPGNLMKLSKLISLGLPFIFSRKNNKRSFVSLNSICEFILKLISSNHPSSTFLIANEKGICLKKIILMLRKNKKNLLPDIILPHSFLKLLFMTIGKSKEFSKLYGTLKIEPSPNCFSKELDWNSEVNWDEIFDGLY